MDAQHKPRNRSLSEPSEFYETVRGDKKGSGFANFLHKLPFLSGRLHNESHQLHSDRFSLSDDEFCDLEEEMKKAAREAKSHKKGHKSSHHKKPDKEESDETGAGEDGTYKILQTDDNGDHPAVTANADTYLAGKNADIGNTANDISKAKGGDSDAGKLDRNGDSNLDDKNKERCTPVSGIVEKTGDSDDEERSEDSYRKGKSENIVANQQGAASGDADSKDTRSELATQAGEEDPPHHEPPPTPLPPPPKSCLKHRSSYEGSSPKPVRRPLRKRSISMPEGDPMIIFRLNRQVHFSPGTIDPEPRNCRYREWIERHCNHRNVSSSVNIKHEKRMQKLKQIHYLDINKYLSKNNTQSYHSAMLSPLRCDAFM